MINLKLFKNIIARNKISLSIITFLNLFFILIFKDNGNVIEGENISRAVYSIISSPFIVLFIPGLLCIILFSFMFEKRSNDFYQAAPLKRQTLLFTLLSVGICVIICLNFLNFLIALYFYNLDILKYPFLLINISFKTILLEIIAFFILSYGILNCKNIIGLILAFFAYILFIPLVIFRILDIYYKSSFGSFEFIRAMIDVYFTQYNPQGTLVLFEEVIAYSVLIFTNIILLFILNYVFKKRRIDNNSTPYYFKGFAYFTRFLLVFGSLVFMLVFAGGISLESTYRQVSISRIIFMFNVGSLVFVISSFAFGFNLSDKLEYFKKNVRTYVIFAFSIVSIFSFFEITSTMSQRKMLENSQLSADSLYSLDTKYSLENSSKRVDSYNSITDASKIDSTMNGAFPQKVFINDADLKNSILDNYNYNINNSGLFSFSNKKVDNRNMHYYGTVLNYANNGYYETVYIYFDKFQNYNFVLSDEQIKDVAEDQLKGVYENAEEFSLVVDGRVLTLKKSPEVFALFVEAQRYAVDYMQLNKEQYNGESESYDVTNDVKIHTKNHVITFKVNNEISKELQKHIVN